MLNLHTLTRITKICGLLSLLTGCYNSMYGIPQQEWVRLNEQQKKAVMDDYYAQQRTQQYNAPSNNYYPAPTYRAPNNNYYNSYPTYTPPSRPRYSEQRRYESEPRRHEIEQRSSDIRTREEFARRARENSNYRGYEEARRHERNEHRSQSDTPIHINPRTTPPYHNNRSDDAPRLPQHNNTAPAKPIQLPRPATDFADPCRGDCKNLTR